MKSFIEQQIEEFIKEEIGQNELPEGALSYREDRSGKPSNTKQAFKAAWKRHIKNNTGESTSMY